MKLFKAMATVAGLTALSRVAGFIRDVLTAVILGAGPVADAFFVALKLPNLFRRVTAEGAFSVSFVPLYADVLEKEGQAKADDFASNAFAVMLLVLSAFTVLAMLAMPWIIYAIAPGFKGDEVRYPMAVDLCRITFPYLLLMSLASLLGGVQNAHGRFAAYAFAPVLFNLALIAALLLWKATGFATAGHALAFGLVAAGVLQFGMLLFFARRVGIVLRLRRPEFNARIKKLFRLMGPGALGAGIMHVNLFADMIMGSLLPRGSISYLYYADRLQQLPLGIVGVAVGTALLPLLSRAVGAGKADEARNLFNRALEMCLFLALPAALGLFIISFPIVATLFMHGAFDFKAAAMTTLVLTAYALGLPPYIAAKVYNTAYWARHDTATPVKASIACALFNIGLSLFLIFKAEVGVVGIAVATSMAGWLQIALLHWGLRGREECAFDERFRRTFLKILASCLFMAAALYNIKPFFTHLYMHDAPVMQRGAALALMIAAGAGVYALSAVLTGVVKISDFKEYFQRKGRDRP